MERNWLIRTFQNQILGPVSKDKLIELINKGSVSINDEVISGNGYWFSLKEKELVDRYLNGDIPQSFNPVSEAKSILIHKRNLDKTTSLNASPPNNRITDKIGKDQITLPPADDLEYPDMGSMTESEPADITKVITLPLAPKLEAAPIKTEATATAIVPPPKANEIPIVEGEAVLPKDDDLEYPDMGEIAPQKAVEEVPVEIKKEVVPEVKVVPPPAPPAKPRPNPKVTATSHRSEKEETVVALYERKPKPTPVATPAEAPKEKAAPVVRKVSKELEKRNDNYLFVIVLVLVIILLGIFFYYREILNKPLPI